MLDLKPCYGKCELCVWKYNGGCSDCGLPEVNFARIAVRL